MHKNTSKIEEKLVSIDAETNDNIDKSAYSTPFTEDYVTKRSEKAEKQLIEEENENKSTQAKVIWDEMVSYKYAIF